MVSNRGGESLNRILALGTLLVLGATLALLLWVASRYRAELDRVVDDAQRSFLRQQLLDDPTDPRVDFTELEALARRAESSQLVRELIVVKQIEGPDGERSLPVHPFYYAAAHPDWPERLKALEARPLTRGLTPLGTLYFDLDTRPLRAVQAAIALAAVLTALALAALLVRILSQQRDLHSKDRILDEHQRALTRMERLALAGQLTANIFHDIRKPVTNIKHEIAELSEALGGFAGATRSLRNLRDQVNLFFDILRDLNIERFVRSEEGDEEYVDVNRVLEQSLKLVQYERGSVQLLVTLTPGLPLVLCQPYHLVQIFSNLILNAYQALEGHGELRIATRAVSEPPQVLVEIEDNGPGIPPECRERVFEPFFSTREDQGGSGLGLYITRILLERLGGSIHLREGDDAQGARFEINLPAGD